jgi:chemotaxis protein MotD
LHEQRVADGLTSVAQPAQSASPVQSSPLQQIADRITASLAVEAGDIGSAPSATQASASSHHAVKVLTIELQPADLGTVTVRIALKDAAVELQVAASRRETARLLDADRDRLSDMLRAVGYHVEAVSVRAVEPPSPALATGPAQGSPGGAPLSQDDVSGAQPRSPPQPAHRQHTAHDHGTRRNAGEPDGAGDRAGRGLYV